MIDNATDTLAAEFSSNKTCMTISKGKVRYVKSF